MDDPKLLDALQRADAAGDTAGATTIAAHIKALRGAPQTPSEAPQIAPVAPSPTPATPAPTYAQKAAGLAGDLASFAGNFPLFNKQKLADQTAGGVGSVVKAGLGAKSMVTDLSPDDKGALNVIEQDAASNPSNRAGQVTGDVARGLGEAALLPAVKGAKVLNAARNIGMGAVDTAIATPGDWTDKGKAAGESALAGLGLSGAGTALKKGATGLFTATKDALDLIKQGITPTLQQGSEGGIGKWIGGLTSGSTNVRGRQEQEALTALTNRASNGQVAAPDATLNQRVGMVQSSQDQDLANFNKGKKFPLNQSIRNDVLSQADALKRSGGRFQDEQGDARAILDNIVGSDTNPTRLSGDNLQSNYIDAITNKQMPRNGPLVNDALENAKQVLIQRSRNAALSSDDQALLKSIQDRQYDLARMKELQAGKGGESEGLNIGKLAKSYGDQPDAATNATNQELVGPLVRTIGTTPRQDESRQLLVNAKRILGLGATGALTGHLPLAATAGAGLYGLSALGQTAGGARALFGQTGTQQAIRRGLEDPALQKLFELAAPQMGERLTGN